VTAAVAIIEVSTATATDDTQRASMAALLESDPEGWSSLRGMMAMLALPELVSGRKRRVEVEVAPDVWEPIDRVSVSPEWIVVAFGVNGHTQEWEYPQPGPVPNWRVEPQIRGTSLVRDTKAATAP
jgi:hypothetical protein